MRRFAGLCVLGFMFLAACGADDEREPADAGTADVDGFDAGVDLGADAQSVEHPLDWEWQARGPYNVGHREWSVEYEISPTGEARTIPLHVWYPTEATEGDRVRYINLFADSEALADVPLAEVPWGDGGYPVHLHSHGHQGYGGASAEILHRFVTHGWVVVAPDHVGDLFVDAESPVSVRTHHVRSQDLTASLDSLEAVGDDPLAGKLDLDNVLLSGHSLGAFTVWASLGAPFDPADVAAQCDERAGRTSTDCAPDEATAFEGLGDDRIAAGIPMAGVLRPEWFTDDAHLSVDVPVLTLTGSEDPVGQSEQWDRITGVDHRWAEFEGACHQFFSIGSCPGFPAAEGQPLLSSFMLAFGRATILGDESPAVVDVVTGGSSLDDRIVYRVR